VTSSEAVHITNSHETKNHFWFWSCTSQFTAVTRIYQIIKTVTVTESYVHESTEVVML